jgi:histidinol-phosphate aminotransferase
MSIDEYIVPWLQAEGSYSEEHLEYAWAHQGIRRMMSNENPVAPSEVVSQAIIKAIKNGNRYPDTGKLLRDKLAKLNEVKQENIILGNGSTEIIDITLRTFLEPGQEVIISIPTFSMYEKRARCNGMKPVLINMTSNMQFDIDTILKSASQKTKLIILCSPNNPTGQQIAIKDLNKILNAGIPTVVDEAYYELERNPKSVAPLVEVFENIIIFRTFSKAYGLAGLRLGYAIASADIIACLGKIKIPWNVNILTMVAALAQLDDAEDNAQKRSVIIEGREYIQRQLDTLPGVIVYPSDGNYVLFDVAALGISSDNLFEQMRDQYGILLRPLQNHHGKDGLIRVTVGTREDNEAFVEALKDFLSK